MSLSQKTQPNFTPTDDNSSVTPAAWKSDNVKTRKIVIYGLNVVR